MSTNPAKTDASSASSNAVKDPDQWATGDESMTGAQASYLKTLCDEAGETFDPHLSKAEMMGGVNRFYDEYYFRPKVVWRIVKEALWDSHERKRLYHEATSFLKLRSERWKWVREGGDAEKPMVAVAGSGAGRLT